MQRVGVSYTLFAFTRNYTKPTIVLEPILSIKRGRHPTIEQNLPHDQCFVANDCLLGKENMVILTGPNMGGKSTFLRQQALIVILAQMGSFVPAQSATVGIVDRIFTRLGARDAVHKGQSTFMAEMVEINATLRNATSHSLILLDELGKCTSPYEGEAIAYAILEYIHDRIEARCIVSTHYRELADQMGKLARVANYTATIEQVGGQLVFTHEVKEGIGDSYALHTARLAGIDEAIILRASACLGKKQ